MINKIQLEAAKNFCDNLIFNEDNSRTVRTEKKTHTLQKDRDHYSIIIPIQLCILLTIYSCS